MKITIKHRLFLTILAATGAVVVSMFLIMQWSIGRGFLGYVNTIEKERMVRLVEVLEHSYAEQGSWDFLRHDRATWFQLVASTFPREGSDAERADRMEKRIAKQSLTFSNLSGEARPPRLAHRFEMRVLLLDAERQPVAGPPIKGGEAIVFKPVLYHGRVAGYLGMLPRLRLTDTHQLLFVKQQKVAMGLIGGVVLLISAALSLPLANRLVLPIKTLASSMHKLASGEYATRVAISPVDELGQLGRDFNTLALSLQKNEEARRQWVADISHELRTPLSILRGEIEAIQDGIRKADANAVRSLHVEVMHLTRLVDDLYQLSLCDIGALSYRKIDLDLGDLLRHAIDSFRPEFDHKAIALKAELDPHRGYPLFADPQRLHQLFDNLLDNALKYTDSGGELSIRLERSETAAHLAFEDTAPGVAPEELERLFDRLYRVENSRNRALGGAGLGLALCKGIVEAHEGSISAHPSSKGGILIKVELPLREIRT